MRRLRVILIAHDSKKADLVAWVRGPARSHATTDELRFTAWCASRCMRPVGGYCSAGDEGVSTRFAFSEAQKKLRVAAQANESRFL
jgi:hypothetical protein